MKAEVAAIKSELSARRSVRRELQVKGKRKKVKGKRSKGKVMAKLLIWFSCSQLSTFNFELSTAPSQSLISCERKQGPQRTASAALRGRKRAGGSRRAIAT